MPCIEFCMPSGLPAWGNNAQRLIVNHAVDTLPYELRPFFESNRNFLMQHVNDPLNLLDKHPSERKTISSSWTSTGNSRSTICRAATRRRSSKYSKSKIESTGLLPWQIGVYSAKLTEDMKNGRWEDAKIDAAFLANYVAEAHDPFNTTENYDGKMTGQDGVNERFNTMLIDRYGSFFPLSPHDASFITRPDGLCVRMLPERAQPAGIDAAGRPPCQTRAELLHGRILRPVLQSGGGAADQATVGCVDGRGILLADGVDKCRASRRCRTEASTVNDTALFPKIAATAEGGVARASGGIYSPPCGGSPGWRDTG